MDSQPQSISLPSNQLRADAPAQYKGSRPVYYCLTIMMLAMLGLICAIIAIPNFAESGSQSIPSSIDKCNKAYSGFLIDNEVGNYWNADCKTTSLDCQGRVKGMQAMIIIALSFTVLATVIFMKYTKQNTAYMDILNQVVFWLMFISFLASLVMLILWESIWDLMQWEPMDRTDIFWSQKEISDGLGFTLLLSEVVIAGVTLLLYIIYEMYLTDNQKFIPNTVGDIVESTLTMFNIPHPVRNGAKSRRTI